MVLKRQYLFNIVWCFSMLESNIYIYPILIEIYLELVGFWSNGSSCTTTLVHQGMEFISYLHQTTLNSFSLHLYILVCSHSSDFLRLLFEENIKGVFFISNRWITSTHASIFLIIYGLFSTLIWCYCICFVDYATLMQFWLGCLLFLQINLIYAWNGILQWRYVLKIFHHYLC